MERVLGRHSLGVKLGLGRVEMSRHINFWRGARTIGECSLLGFEEKDSWAEEMRQAFTGSFTWPDYPEGSGWALLGTVIPLSEYKDWRANRAGPVQKPTISLRVNVHPDLLLREPKAVNLIAELLYYDLHPPTPGDSLFLSPTRGGMGVGCSFSRFCKALKVSC